MRFETTFIDDVRSSVSIIDLVSGYVSLKKSGQNYAGLCPFHREKTPSFLVSESKQIFKCFGCGEGGDVFKFFSLVESVGFGESVKSLAQKYGIPLPNQSPQQQKQAEERTSLLQIMEVAQAFFVEQLAASVVAQRYINERGLTDDTVQRFGLGFAPPGNLLLSHLEKRGIPAASSISCGLLKENDRGDIYDKFRNRVTFPIRDLSGRTIAFGGRALGDGIPKYLNSPDTPLYKKSLHLYGLDVARDKIREAHYSILVEGYFDCIVPAQFGFANTVASLGTSLTEQQVELLSRYGRKVVICYDPDTAGQSAAARSIDIFLKHRFEVNVACLPDGQDPDTFLNENGKEAFRQQLQTSARFIDFLLNRFIGLEKDPRSPRSKQEIVSKITPYLMSLPDRIERSEYAHRVGDKVGVDGKLILAEMRRLRRPTRASDQKKRNPSLTKTVTPSEALLLRAVLDDKFSDAVVAKLDPQLFAGLTTQYLFAKVLEMRELGQEISIFSLQGELEDPADVAVLENLDRNLPVSEEWSEASIAALQRRKRFGLQKQNLQEELRALQQTDPSSARIVELIEALTELRRAEGRP